MATPSERLRLAVGLAQAGYRIFPLKPNTKEPATKHGFKDATSDVEQVTAWWEANPEYNIGLATGMQDNDLWIGVIDVDAKHGGVLAWKQLTRDNGSAWMRHMPIHKTPRDGYHIFGQADPALKLGSANGFPEGIDTRGDGGYVVLPDSVFIDPDTGMIGNYRCTENSLWSIQPGTFPAWVIAMWTPPVIERPPSPRHPSMQGDSPADWCRANMDLLTLMTSLGWTPGRPDREGRTPLTRPGKSRGISANLQPGGDVVFIFTTEIPEYAKPFGRGSPEPNNYSAWDFLCGFVFKGDTRAAVAAVREKMPPPPLPVGQPTAAEGKPNASANALGLVHPAEFWDQLPLLAALRDAAWSMAASPDAMLIAWLTHYATAIPPGYRLPAIIGDDGTFDLLSVLVGDSGAKKSSVMRRAGRLTPLTQRKDLRVDQDIGSGEGIIDAYYDITEEEVDGKKVRERRKVYTGINFKVDEGKVINDLNHRQGTTHTSRLCSAWSGSTLSTTNASADRKRFIEEFTYRLTAVICAQPAYAVAFLQGDSALQGFAQRLLWAWCHDPNKPEPQARPSWPGVLDIPIPPSIGLTYLDVAPEIIHQVQWEDHDEAHGGLDAHRNLLRLKVAGVLTLACDERSITAEMWEVAGQIISQSVKVRAYLLDLDNARERELDINRAEAAGRRQALTEDAHARATLGRTTDRVSALLQARGPLSFKELKDLVSRPQRPFLRAALDVLIDLGKVAGEAGSKFRLL